VASYLLGSQVEEDLGEIWEFIAKDNAIAATRVMTAVEETFQLLADFPGLGRPIKTKAARIRKLRFRPVLGFEHYLIFYQEIPTGIEIFHVYHAARNIATLLRGR
jgi:plasmid stabilization system protein ParE